jgi:iron complex outermembrane receptor protein
MSKQLIAFVLSVMLYTTVSAQTVIRGKVTSAESGEAVIGATVIIKGKLIGTVTNYEGVFELSTAASLPLTLEISYMGYQKTSYDVRDSSPIAIRLETSMELLSEVVFSASRIEEPLFESAVTVEKMDLKTIRESPDFSFYDGVQNLRGVDQRNYFQAVQFPRV